MNYMNNISRTDNRNGREPFIHYLIGGNRMKRILIIMMIVFIVALTGCNKSSKESTKVNVKEKEEPMEQQTNEKVPISLQLLKIDIDSGVTIENSTVYSEVDRRLKNEPYTGADDDFSVFFLDIVDSGTEDVSLLFIAVNRLNKPIKNIFFNYTLGYENGGFLWDGAEIILSEEYAGVIKPNHALPFKTPITAEQEEMFLSLDEKDHFAKIENFSFESAE